jgi:CRISPR-associated protein Csa1
VYFLSAEEQRYVMHGLLPRSREVDVAEELRGWRWAEPPLRPPYERRLTLWEVASKYCPTGRDVYLRHIQAERGAPNVPMVAGSVYHEVLVRAVTQAKRLLYLYGVEGYQRAVDELQAIAVEDGLERWRAPVEAAESAARLMPGTGDETPSLWEEVLAGARSLWSFETTRIAARVQELAARHPHLSEDALVWAAVPVVVQQRLDGTLLGLSRHLSADAFTAAEPMIVDVKFGERCDFDRLSVAGYALVMESLHEFPVNIGCVVYARRKGGRWLIEKDFHLIDDELRQWFLEERDEKMRLVEGEIDPGLPPDCPLDCPYFRPCHPGQGTGAGGSGSGVDVAGAGKTAEGGQGPDQARRRRRPPGAGGSGG